METGPASRPVLRLDFATGGAWIDGRPVTLTRAELALAHALGQGRVRGRADLLRSIGLAASPRRIDVLLVRLRRVLGPGAVRTVRGRGWLLALEVDAVNAPTAG